MANSNNEKARFCILIVDDEEDLREILTFNLESQGYLIACAASAEEALAKDLTKFDLLLLDVMMPGMSGFKLAEVIRKERKLTMPIIFLTAKDTENDLLTGFSLGADDYISKPFSVKELQARVHAVLNRAKEGMPAHEANSGKICVGDLEIDLMTKRAMLNGDDMILTKKELEILTLLASQPERVYSRNEILDKVWREESYVMERTVDVHITRLRKKLKGSTISIVNRSGFGYCLSDRDDESDGDN